MVNEYHKDGVHRKSLSYRYTGLQHLKRTLLGFEDLLLNISKSPKLGSRTARADHVYVRRNRSRCHLSSTCTLHKVQYRGAVTSNVAPTREPRTVHSSAILVRACARQSGG